MVIFTKSCELGSFAYFFYIPSFDIGPLVDIINSGGDDGGGGEEPPPPPISECACIPQNAVNELPPNLPYGVVVDQYGGYLIGLSEDKTTLPNGDVEVCTTETWAMCKKITYECVCYDKQAIDDLFGPDPFFDSPQKKQYLLDAFSTGNYKDVFGVDGSFLTNGAGGTDFPPGFENVTANHFSMCGEGDGATPEEPCPPQVVCQTYTTTDCYIIPGSGGGGGTGPITGGPITGGPSTFGPSTGGPGTGGPTTGCERGYCIADFDNEKDVFPGGGTVPPSSSEEEQIDAWETFEEKEGKTYRCVSKIYKLTQYYGGKCTKITNEDKQNPDFPKNVYEKEYGEGFEDDPWGPCSGCGQEGVSAYWFCDCEWEYIGGPNTPDVTFPQGNIITLEDLDGVGGCNCDQIDNPQDVCKDNTYTKSKYYKTKICRELLDPDPGDNIPGGIGGTGGGIGGGTGGGTTDSQIPASNIIPPINPYLDPFDSGIGSKIAFNAYRDTTILQNEAYLGFFDDTTIEKNTKSLNKSLKSKFLSIKDKFSNTLDVIKTLSRQELDIFKNKQLRNPDIELYKTTLKSKLVNRKEKYSSIFKNKINESINYTLDMKDSFNDWNQDFSYGLNSKNILKSLNASFSNLIKTTYNIDGTTFSEADLVRLIRSRLIDGSLDKLPLNKLRKICKDSIEYSNMKKINPSYLTSVDELVVIDMIKSAGVPLDFNPEDKTIADPKLLDITKTIASDTEKYIDVNINGINQKYYINDNDSILDNNKYYINDNDTFSITYKGTEYILPVNSKKSQAYLLPEDVRFNILKILNEDPSRKLYSQLDSSSFDYEFNYDLNINDNSAPRKNVYFLKIDPDSIKTTNSQISDIVVNTDAKYELVDYETEEGLAEINEFIKLKYNHRTIILSHDDILLDHLEGTSSLNFSQNDVSIPFAKENESLPLVVRNFPWYIMVLPTNRPDYNLFNDKSKIVNISEDLIIREARIVPSPDKDFFRQSSPLFVRANVDNITFDRELEFSIDNDIYKTVYVDDNGNYGRPSEIHLRREKSSIRLIKEIIEELDDNYVLGENPKNKKLNQYDVFGRLSFKEYNSLLYKENYSVLKKALSKGIFRNVKVGSSTNVNRNDPSRSTKLVKRRNSASQEDKFILIKSDNQNRYIEPPDKDKMYSAKVREVSTNELDLDRIINSRIN